MRRVVALLILLFALTATSCSQLIATDNALPMRNDVLIDAMTNDIIFQDDPLTSDPGEAGCIAKGVFGVIGASRLNEAGLTVQYADVLGASLTTAEFGSIESIISDCTGATSSREVSAAAAAEAPAAQANQPAAAVGTDAVVAAAPVVAAQPADAGPSRAELVDYMVDDFFNEPAAPGEPLPTRSEVECMVEGTIDLLGLDMAGIEEFAFSDSEATRTEHNAFVDAYSVCVDVIAEFAAGLAAGGFFASEASCTAQQFGRDNIVAMMKNGYGLPDDADLSPAEEVELFAAMDRCGIE